MTYPALGHDRDSNCVHYLLDNLHTSSSCDTTCQPDIEREFIEHHYGDCSCIFCNLRLLNIGDIHNNSMLLHVCESSLNQGSPSSKWRVRTDNTSLQRRIIGSHSPFTTGTTLVKRGFAHMQKHGVIMDVTNIEQAQIAEDAGAVAVMVLDKLPFDVRLAGGVARTASVKVVQEIMDAVTIPIMAKCRIGHLGEAQILEEIGVHTIDESEVLTPADEDNHLWKWSFKVPFVNGAKNLGEALRRIEEGCSMIRTKGEPGTGNVAEAVSHIKLLNNEIDRLRSISHDRQELIKASREL